MIKKLNGLKEEFKKKRLYTHLLNELGLNPNDKNPKVNALELKNLPPGEIILTKKPIIVTTLLKEGLAITMYNKRLKIAAIAHPLLPGGEINFPPQELKDFRFINCSFDFIYQWFINQGSTNDEMEIKVFGGSRQEDDDTDSDFCLNTGKQNIKKIRSLIESYNCPKGTGEVGGDKARKFIFYSESGEVRIKRINEKTNENVSIQFDLENPVS